MGLFGSSKKKKLQKKYEKVLKEAQDAQRSGDIQKFSAISEEANSILEEIKKLGD